MTPKILFALESAGFDGPTCIIIVGIVVASAYVVKYIRSRNSAVKTGAHATRHLGPNGAEITITESEGIRIVQLSGAYDVTFGTGIDFGIGPEVPARVILTVTDVTEDLPEPKPIFCINHAAFGFPTPGLALARDVVLPHLAATVQRLPVGPLPPKEAIVCPHRGRRKIKIEGLLVFGERTLMSASIFRNHTQDRYGYAELDVLAEDAVCRLARLGLIVAGIDGKIDSKEAKAVQQFLRERISTLDVDRDLKTAVNAAFKDQLAEGLGSASASAKASEICEMIRLYDPHSAEETAYELALKVTAADGKIDPKEEAVLLKIQEALELDDKTVEKLRDLHVRLASITSGSDEKFFEIDPSLPIAVKNKMARKLYRKWQGRVTHTNPSIRLDAEERVRRLGELLARYASEDDSDA